jgi:ABC-type multidrug transport system ATPase subunit
MIDVSGLRAARTPFSATPLTVRFGPGAHALLGRQEDGVGALLAVLAGRGVVRGGRCEIAGKRLGTVEARRAVAYVPREVSLPDALRVEEAFRVADAIRGSATATVAARLESMGIAHLARRSVRTLAPEEARAVALAEAITSCAPVLLLEEPLTGMEPQAAAYVRAGLRARAARTDACLVVATASVRDATELADDVLVFDRGVLVRRSGPSDALTLGVTLGARVRVLCADPRALTAALATEPATRAIEAEAEGAVVASGATLREVAAAIGRAAVRAQVDVQALVPEPAPLEEIRAAASGDAAGAYRGAWERARAAALAQPPQPQRGPAP